MIINIPLNKGLAASEQEFDWVDQIPGNFLAVPKPVLDSQGYLQSFPGLTLLHSPPLQDNLVPVPRGAVYNSASRSVFRVFGRFLTDETGRPLVQVGGEGYAPMPFSQSVRASIASPSLINVNIQGIVTDGKLKFWDGTELTELSEWTDADSITATPSVDFGSLDTIIDAVRNKGRYIWLAENSDVFGVTALENFRRPDPIAPLYQSDSDIGRIIALGSWRDWVITFSRNSIQFFGLTGSESSIYQSSASLTVRCGIIGQRAQCLFGEGFAVLGNPIEKPPSVYMIFQGKFEEIATRYIQKQIERYSEIELSMTVLEPIKFRNHNLLLVSLPSQSFVYDMSTQLWSELFSNVAGTQKYSGQFHIIDGTQWTLVDSTRKILAFDFESAKQNKQQVVHILNTPLLQVRNQRLFDLEVDGIFGAEGDSVNIGLSTTLDGRSYGIEELVNFSMNLNRTKRVLKRRLGYVQNNIGFRLRIISDRPISISNLRVRVE